MENLSESVDVAHSGVLSAIYNIKGIQESIQKAKGLAEATEATDCEFKYARIAGQLMASIDIIGLAVEIIEYKLEDADSALRNIKGEI